MTSLAGLDRACSDTQRQLDQGLLGSSAREAHQAYPTTATASCRQASPTVSREQHHACFLRSEQSVNANRQLLQSARSRTTLASPELSSQPVQRNSLRPV